MKHSILFSLAIFISFAAGCEKNEPSSQASDTHQINAESNTLADNFQNADDKITTLIDQIENPEISPSNRQQVLCQDFPKVYQHEYIPALLALNPKDTSQAQLLEEMQFTLDYYQKQLNIQCV